jgi:hypothetical protein
MFRKVLGSRTLVLCPSTSKSLITAAKRRFRHRLSFRPAHYFLSEEEEKRVMRSCVRTVTKSAVALGFAATMAIGAIVTAKAF